MSHFKTYFFMLSILILSMCENSTKSINTPPEGNFTFFPIDGNINNLFIFDASTSKDKEDDTKDLLVRWDFNSDRYFDTKFSIQKQISYQYSDTGEFRILLEVKDLGGASDTISKCIYIKTMNKPPTASLIITKSGNTFLFDASGCTDFEDDSNKLKVRWDWENDGTWDTEYSTNKKEEHKYSDENSYYVRLEVMDSEGSTGQLVKNTQFEIVEDIDGNFYKIVKIGNQWWMTENLKVTHYCNGDPIPKVTDGIEWGNLTTGAYCFYNNSGTHAIKYGALYNSFAVDDERNIAPEGWHVPTDEEWEQLAQFISDDNGGYSNDNYGHWYDVGGHLKSTSGWGTFFSTSGNGTDDYGFNALPSGHQYWTGHCSSDGLGMETFFWSATNKPNSNAWIRKLDISSYLLRNNNNKKNGFSVRCIKDKE